MRVLQVIRTLDPAWGGPVEVVKTLCPESEKRDLAVEVACVDEPHSSWLKSWSVPVHAVGAGFSQFGYTRKLDDWLSANVDRFDAVVVHGIWMYFSFAVWKATRDARVPYYVYTHGALDPWFKKQYPYKQIKKTAYWRLFEHKVLRDAEAVLFTTEEEKLLAHNSFEPYQCNAAVVGLGISPPPHSDRRADRQGIIRELSARYPKLRNRNFILFLGRIHEKKGIDLLLESFAQEKASFGDTALVITGPGDKSAVDRLQALGEKLGVGDQTVWTGPLYDDAKWDAMNAADVYALPSHQENFGVSVVEALACGTPVLISNKVNIWREVEAAGAGLVDDDDLAGTARLLQQWKNLSSASKQSMRARARSCFSEHFDIQSSSNRLFDLLSSVPGAAA